MLLPRPTRHHTDPTTFHCVFNAFLAVLTSLYVPTQFLFRSTRVCYCYIVSMPNPFEARSTRLYYISTTSTRLQSDQQRFRYKYREHINDALLIWKSNFWLINMLYFSMEQMQMLSTLNMMTISSL